MRTIKNDPVKLKRSLSLPMLVFYGVGVTVGAGIFALIGEIVGIAGSQAPLAFLIAGFIAAATGLSYAKLASLYPRAGGEAVFVKVGLGPLLGRLVGLGVVATAIISSAVVSLAFAGYFQQLVDIPTPLITSVVVISLAGIAWLGVRESVIFAAVITVLELGTLAYICWLGFPHLDVNTVFTVNLNLFAPNTQVFALTSAAMIAFFAFIGFEDIENMAEETTNPRATVPRAILITLSITIVIYMLVALVAVNSVDISKLAQSDAPIADLYSALSGRDGDIIAAIATTAMVNGILVQIVMAARVLYGMANEKLVPQLFAHLDPKRQTPSFSTWFVAAMTIVLALSFPLVHLARVTSVIILCVFVLVNFSLWRIGGSKEHAAELKNWKWLGLFGAIISAALLVSEAVNFL
ncbi:APC family permease [Maritalea sp.]|uniref:APC family permease n=1 Tax=Maritalea sp. TaxID=2003361 RepID=UPI003EF133A6